METTNKDFKEVEEGVLKVGSVYILEEDKWNSIKLARDLLLDLFGTINNFKQVYNKIVKNESTKQITN